MDKSEITLPAYWASALVNNDYSGLDNQNPDEGQRCRKVVADLAKDGWSIVSDVDGSEPRFTWHYQLYDPGADCSGGDVLDYVILRSTRVSTENGKMEYLDNYLSPYTIEVKPLPWQTAGLQQTASGYGNKLTSSRVVRLSDGRVRRVYVTCWSNCGTAWIILDGRKLALRESD